MNRKNFSRYISLILLFLLSVTFIAGCGLSKKEVLSEYKKSVQPILEDLAQASEKWDVLRRKSSNGQISDFEVAIIIKNELVPNLIKLQEKMERIAPNKDLRSTHELGIKMISKNIQALNEVTAGIYARDMSKMTSANSLLSESRELERKYANQLEDYAK